jgi:3-hydroxybutyryl-CoA dehydrogenase
MSYTLPADIDQRPVFIAGAGTLGRRLAAVFASGGSDVRVFDVSDDQREAARAHAEQEASAVRAALELDPVDPGRVEAVADLAVGAAGAWMIIEAVPERLELKVEVFGELDRIADEDAILCSNSSSLPSSQMIAEVERPERVLNTHYYQPPELNCVELMSCGHTDEAIIDGLMDKLPQYGIVPFHVRRESDGFIFNRIWAAIKRECIMVLEEGVATPEDVDELWRIFTAPGVPPFRLMDRVGLDVVLAIEEHYAEVRSGLPEAPRRLLREYVDQGRLGVKSGRGFYDPAEGDAGTGSRR